MISVRISRPVKQDNRLSSATNSTPYSRVRGGSPRTASSADCINRSDHLYRAAALFKRLLVRLITLMIFYSSRGIEARLSPLNLELVPPRFVPSDPRTVIAEHGRTLDGYSSCCGKLLAGQSRRFCSLLKDDYAIIYDIKLDLMRPMLGTPMDLACFAPPPLLSLPCGNGLAGGGSM